MDLQQRKLTKSEWDSIEQPINAKEVEILKLIIRGYQDVDIKYNNNHTLLTYLKMESVDNLDDHLFQLYFLQRYLNILSSSNIPDDDSALKHLQMYNDKWKTKSTFKKSLSIKLQRYTADMIANESLLENTLLSLLNNMIKNKYGEKNVSKKNKKNTLTNVISPNDTWSKYFISLQKILSFNLIPNKHIKTIIQTFLTHWEENVSIIHVIKNSADYIEQNQDVLRYADITLYRHQKDIFMYTKQPGPKLIMYTAPTGTGKTMTPIGLLSEHRVIFVCAARHVGLALAKSAINVQKKVAFAFGCETADDIRLHYFAAKDYTKNYKSGSIFKVDNSVGDRVELMICDVKSYLSAMYYMLAFNEKENIITYWDEPTITMDYPEHECHRIIQKNWTENKIPNLVLSSATLPKMEELMDSITDFKCKFATNEPVSIFNILSSDCKKSVPIVNKYGYVVSPHNLSNDFYSTKQFVNHCKNNPVLMRYFDMCDISKAIVHANINNYTSKPVDRYFDSVKNITMQEIKIYYLDMLLAIKEPFWKQFYIETYNNRELAVSNYDASNQLRKVKSMNNSTTITTNDKDNTILKRTVSMAVTDKKEDIVGTYISTKDSHTLTDGPTIYLSNEPEKIAKFCIQQANIPEIVMKELLQSIEFNNNLNEKIDKIERDLEDALPKENSTESKHSGKQDKNTNDNTKKIERLMTGNSTVAKLREKLDLYRKMIKSTQLNDTFVPNKKAHLDKWANGINASSAFTSTIDEEIIVKIMSLNDVSNSWKILLMLGIGVFTNHTSIDYTEIMKQLAEQQRLYLIIASSDYIYGTNYQFCHGYISKNMKLSQEKLIQAIGRVGRNGIQQKYTIRFRDDEPIFKLFTHEENKPEVNNMNRLFNSLVV